MKTAQEAQQKKAVAQLRHLRISPRKVRLVANLIKGLPVSDALAQLHILSRKPSDPLKKLVESAKANAKSEGLDEKKLVVSSITVDKGPMLKRWMPRAQGRATPIHKMTSHISITLTEKGEGKESKFITDTKKEKTTKKDEKKEVEKTKQEPKKPEKEEVAKKERPVDTKGHAPKIFRRKSV